VVATSQVGYFWPLQLRLTRVRRQDFFNAVLLRGLLPAMVGSAVWVALRVLFPPHTWLSLVVVGAIGVVAYLVTLLSLCLDEGDRKTVNRLASKVLGQTAQ